MYSHTMEHYSAIKRDKLLKYATTWMNSKNIMMNERSQLLFIWIVQFFLYKVPEKAKLISSDKKEISDCLGPGLGDDWEVNDRNVNVF